MARVTLNAIIDADTKKFNAAIDSAMGKLKGLGNERTLIAGLGVAAAGSSAQLLSLGNQATMAAKALISISPASLVALGQAGTVVTLALKSGTAEAEKFTKSWEKVGEVLTKASTTVLPGLNKMMDQLKTNLPVVAKGFEQTGKVIGELASQAGKVLSGPLFRAELAQIMEMNNVSIMNFGTAVVTLLGPLTDLVAVGAQVLAAFTAQMPMWAQTLSNYTAAERASGNLAKGMIEGLQALTDFVRVIFNFGGAIKNVMEAANTASGDTMGKLADQMLRLKTATDEGTAGQERLVQFFVAVNNIGAGVVDIFIGIGEGMVTFFNALSGGTTDLASFSESVRDIGESFREWVNSASTRAQIIDFAERARITFEGLSQIFNAAAVELQALSNNDTVQFFMDLGVAIAAAELTLLTLARLVPGLGLAMTAIGAPVRILAVAIAYLGTSSDEIVGPLSELAGSVAKVATAVLDATEPLFQLAAALAGIVLTGAAAVVGALAVAMSGLASAVGPLTPLIIGFAAAWAGMAFASWISGLGGIVAALTSLYTALGIAAAVHALQTAFIALEVVGGTLIPTLAGVRAALLGLAVVTGIVGALAGIAYVLIEIGTAGRDAEKAAEEFVGAFNAADIGTVRDKLAAVNTELTTMSGNTDGLEHMRNTLVSLSVTFGIYAETISQSSMSLEELAVAVGANSAAVDGSTESIHRFNEELSTGLQNVTEIGNRFDVTTDGALELADALGIDLQSSTESVRASLDAIGPPLADAAATMGLTAIETVNLTAGLIDLTGDAGLATTQLENVSATINGIQSITPLSAQAIVGLATTLSVDLTGGVGTANTALDSIKSKLEAEVPFASALTTTALNNIGLAALAAKGEIDHMNLSLSELANQNNVQLQLATTALRIEQFGQGATLARDATGGFSLALTQNEVAMRGQIQAILQSVSTLYNQEMGLGNTTTAATTATAKFEEFTTQLFANTVAQGGNVDELVAMFNQLGLTIGNDGSGVMGLNRHLGEVPAVVPIDIQTPDIQAIIRQVDALSQSLNEAARPRSIRLTAAVTGGQGFTSGAGAGSGGLAPRPRALGGPVEANMPFLVGEEGPELFVPKAMGEIIDATKTKNLLEASGQNQTPAASGNTGAITEYGNGLEKLSRVYDSVSESASGTNDVLMGLGDSLFETDRQTLLLGDETSRTERQVLQWNNTLSDTAEVVAVSTEANALLTTGIQENTLAGEENYLGLTNLTTQMDLMNAETYPVMLEAKTLDTTAQVENTLATTENLVSQTDLGLQMTLMSGETYPLLTEATTVQSLTTAENTVFNAENLVSLIENQVQLDTMSGVSLPTFTVATDTASVATTAFSATQVEANANVQTVIATVTQATATVNEYTAATEAVPPAVETVYTTPGLLEAIANTGALAAAQDSVERAINITYTTSFVNVGAPASFAGNFASGGEIRGPGGPTSDSMIAAVSNREWVINAAVAERQGRAKMAALNAGAAEIVTGGSPQGASSTITISGPLVSVSVQSTGGENRELARMVGEIVNDKMEDLLEDIVNSIDSGVSRH